MKQLWKAINGLAQYKKQTMYYITNIVNDLGEKIMTEQETGNIFNSFFH